SNSGTPTFTALSGDIASITGAGSVTLKSVGTANTYGSASVVPVITTDAQGRVSGVVNTSIAIDASQITTGQLTAVRGGTGADLSGAAQYSLPYFSAAGVLGGVLTPGTAGYVLTTNNSSGAPTWTNPATLIPTYWDQANGALYPKNTTVDLLLGGTSTGSAKFAFTNVSGGTPTASTAGNVIVMPTIIGGNQVGGNVGIGTNNPDARLTIQGSAGTEVNILTDTNSISDESFIEFNNRAHVGYDGNSNAILA